MRSFVNKWRNLNSDAEYHSYITELVFLHDLHRLKIANFTLQIQHVGASAWFWNIAWSRIIADDPSTANSRRYANNYCLLNFQLHTLLLFEISYFYRLPISSNLARMPHETWWLLIMQFILHWSFYDSKPIFNHSSDAFLL